MKIDGHVSTPANASSGGPIQSTGSANGRRCCDATAATAATATATTTAAESKSVIEPRLPLGSYSSLGRAYCALYS
jgi:hypothetical protein